MKLALRIAAVAWLVLSFASFHTTLLHAQDQTASAEESIQAPAALDEEELEILVARIALYPDELVGLIASASLYPLQVVEAARFLGEYEKDNSLEPKDSWDGSIISLLNYPEVLNMMSEDLDWTQSLGDALAYQQEDVLQAIQQLREEAVANNVIQSDDKMTIVQDNDNVVIQSASPETIYVPQYEPEMLYTPDYAMVPVGYYPDPYPNYYYPTATFFAGAVTGAVWASVVDWDDNGIWGGNWNGGDVDIDCNNCFNNRDFNGKVNINDVDWKNVDRSKINIDKNQFSKLDQKDITNNIKSNNNNSIKSKASTINKDNATRNSGVKDVRKSKVDATKGKGGNGAATSAKARKPAAAKSKPSAAKTNKSRPAGKKKPAAKADNRPKKPSGMGKVSKKKAAQARSSRGSKSMGGGHRSSAPHKSVKRGGGGRHR